MKKQKMYKLQACVFLMGVLAAAVFFNKEAPAAEDKTKLTTSILKVGRADAIILQNRNKTMLIDAGEEDDGLEISEFLRERNIKKIDALIITHYDKDHVGGADTVVENFAIGDVYLPDYKGTGTDYSDFMTALDERGIKAKRVNESVSFAFADCSVVIDPPLSYDISVVSDEYDNNFSLITTVCHGSKRLVFAGDAEKIRLREWLSGQTVEKCDFLKIPHHGVYNTELENLISQTAPEYAVITDSKNNKADSLTLDLLAEYAVKTCESRNGNITVISDGNDIKVYQ